MSSTHTFTIQVTDSLGATDSQLMTVNLSNPNSNSSSILQGYTSTFANEGDCCGNPVGTNDNWRILRDHVGIHFYASGSLPPPASEAVEGRGYVDLATGQYAVYNGGTWVTYPPKAGLLAQDMTSGELYYNTGSSWATIVGGTSGAVTPTNVATVANILTPSTSSGNFVTDNVLRTALGSGQDFSINTARNGGVSQFISLDSSGNAVVAVARGSGPGSGVYGQVEDTATGNGVSGFVLSSGPGSGVRGQVNGSGSGYGTFGVVAGSGSGHGAVGVVSGSGSGSGVLGEIFGPNSLGHGVHGRVGFAASATGGDNSAGYFESGSSGSRLATLRSVVNNATTTAFGIWTNSSIFAAGTVTTSDKRLKREIKSIDGELAYKLLQSINFTHYKKLMDADGVKQNFERLKASSTKELQELLDDKIGSKTEEKRERIAELEAVIAQEVDTSDEAMFLTKQAGIIAQELQAITKKLKAFDWLVKLSDPKDKDSKLVIDTESLQFVLLAGQQYFNAKVEAFMLAQTTLVSDGK